LGGRRDLPHPWGGVVWPGPGRLPPGGGTVKPGSTPRPLDRVDADRYRQIFELQAEGRWLEADEVIGRLTDLRLLGHVLADRYLSDTYRTSYAELVSWLGVLFCFSGLSLLLWSLVSFGQSFRVGIDTEHPDKLITTGVFALSRNPIYLAFALILLGPFLIFPNWILPVYLSAGIWLFHRQVLREEEYLKGHYGEEYAAYCGRVRRYL